MMITGHVPIGSHQFVGPGDPFTVPPDTPAWFGAMRVGTVVAARGGPDGHSIDVDIDMSSALFERELLQLFDGLTFDPPTPTPEDQTS